ncbi:hypothetical protein SKAU_G00146780 [Synaphobranchus kaupii]|uniref:Uncharacterized protein n=1 Tax=Synaphobranchus kaupii TaxID=118154 RepID=A0A9Q1FUD7_SYNKA|nr:hypothetical protein SKAU_G00146780 [Synaphobranchus kaupii]
MVYHKRVTHVTLTHSRGSENRKRKWEFAPCGSRKSRQEGGTRSMRSPGPTSDASSLTAGSEQTRQVRSVSVQSRPPRRVTSLDALKYRRSSPRRGPSHYFQAVINKSND